jgi:5'-nucleotidase
LRKEIKTRILDPRSSPESGAFRWRHYAGNTRLLYGERQQFLKKLSLIQQRERERSEIDPAYKPKLRVSIVTARNAPAHERVVNTLREWGISINEAFFLGGVEKRLVLEILQPHIFFDDQKLHLESAAGTLPCVHIPFGIRNQVT